MADGGEDIASDRIAFLLFSPPGDNAPKATPGKLFFESAAWRYDIQGGVELSPMSALGRLAS